jgi:hypothetical protein
MDALASSLAAQIWTAVEEELLPVALWLDGKGPIFSADGPELLRSYISGG